MKKSNNAYPKVNITKCGFDQYSYQYDNMKWDAATMVAFCKRKDYKTFDMPLACVNLKKFPFVVDSFSDFIYHAQRVNNADLKYPILLDDDGIICDGWHRIAKALLEGKTSIKAIRMEEMPNVSGYTEVKE